MIKLKERYDCDWRLYDTVTGEYVKNTARNRNEALFCELLGNEIEKGKNGSKHLHSVNEMLWLYYQLLEKSTKFALDKSIWQDFLAETNEYFQLNNLKDNENFQKLALCVLADQYNPRTKLNGYEVEILEGRYQQYNDEIFAKEQEK